MGRGNWEGVSLGIFDGQITAGGGGQLGDERSLAMMINLGGGNSWE